MSNQNEKAPEQVTTARAERVKKVNKKATIIATAVTVSALIVIYIALVLFFQNHFLFRTTINGVNVGGVSPAKAVSRIENTASNYSLLIVPSEGSTEKITMSEVGMKVSADKEYITSLQKEQNQGLWFVSIVKPYSIVSERIVSVDDEMILDRVNNLECVKAKNTKPTLDAYVEYQGGEYVIVPEVIGTSLDAEAFALSCKTALLSLDKSIDLYEDKCYKQPTYTADSKRMKVLCDTLNGYIKSGITYQVGSETYTPDPSEVSKWVTTNEKGKIEFDDEAITAFVKEMGSKYNTVGKAKSLHTQNGADIQVPGGNLGWRIDVEAEVAQIKEDLKSGKAVTRDFIYSETAVDRSGADKDYGNTYVEVDLATQHVWLVKNGEMIFETDCVTGCLEKGHGTHVGAYKVAYKEKDATLRGADYESHVAYWMPFHNGEGLHDATWRGAFGGKIFYTNGSHGCVNLPKSSAKFIFENIEKGCPVLVYASEPLPQYDQIPEIDEATQAAVNYVTDKINQIGTVNLFSKAKIQEAYNAYNSLSESAKMLVPNVGVLTQAIEAYKQFGGI